MSKPAFEEVATQYDNDFTHTRIGLMQRQRIWAYLAGRFKSQSLDILEINGGTGEDAIFLAREGHKITHTDIAEQMLEVAQKKVAQAGLLNSIQFQRIDLRNPINLKTEFDLILSNFGGINCLSPAELSNLNSWIFHHLRDNGECILVVMPKQNWFDKIYRYIKGEYQIYQQRSNPKGLKVNLDENVVQTYYYDVVDIIRAFKSFKLKGKIAAGYLPSYFNKSKFIELFYLADKAMNAIKVPVNYADHYLIHLVKQ